jgi:putative phage-type endonuclease
MKKLTFKNGSPEWLRVRMDHVTATDIASLFGLNPYKSANKVYKSKLVPEVIADNIYMREGRIYEPAVFQALYLEGIAAEQPGNGEVVMMIHDECKLSASLDGYVEKEGKMYVVEAKTTRGKIMSWYEQAPAYYVMQVYAQIAVTGYCGGLLACLGLDSPSPLVVYYIKPNKEIQDLMVEEVNRFWNCIKENKEFKVKPAYKAVIQKQLYSNVTLIKS